MRRPNSIVGYTTALAFILAGCAINIEATDLSAVTVKTDRTVIEQELGKPDEVVEVHGFTVASYTYDKGFYKPAPSGGSAGSGGSSGGPYAGYALLGILLIAAVVLPIKHAVDTSEAKAQQKGRLAAIFDADNKLVFAGSLEESDAKISSLAELAAAYETSHLESAAALINLRDIALIPEQRKRLHERWFAARELEVESGDAESQYELAGLATEGADKIKWLRKAAAQGYTKAQFSLGAILLHGRSSLVDRKEAIVWLTKAAQAGNSDAQTELAKFSSIETKLTDADQGHLKAQLELAERYRYGRNVSRDLGQAIRLYVRAAVSGDDYAPYALGNIYADGEAGTVNANHAYMWYSIAARVSADDAEELHQRRRDLAKIMSPDDVTEAERLADEWTLTHPK